MLKRWFISSFHALLIIIPSLICGLLAMLITARYFPRPVVFFGVGIVVFLILYISLILLKKRGFQQRKKSDESKNQYTFAISILLLLMVIISLVRPLNDLQRDPEFVAAQAYWELPDGLKLSYIHLSVNTNSRKPPVIFLHGGPGVPDMAGDAAYLQPLVEEGYEVYVYEQIGSGRSSRLKDPGEYNVSRDVGDLEWIRSHIEADKLILIGHSYGGVIAAHYLANYGDYVDKAVFLSPGPIDPKDQSGGNLVNRLSSSERRSLYAALLHPRVLMTYTLLQVNPKAAISFVGDDEMDARFDRVYANSRPALYGNELPVGPDLYGLGFYANQTPQSAARTPYPDIRYKLAGKDTLSLIIKGSKDYLSWSSASELKRQLPRSSMVYLQNAGHNIYQDQPDLVMEILRTFLEEHPLPIKVYSGDEMPSDYEGVP